MGKIRAFFAASFALGGVLLCAPAMAQLKAENVYAGLSFGEARDRDACAGLSGCTDRPDALRGFAGYQFHPRFAVEAGYANLGNVRATGGTFVRTSAWDAVLVGSWPLASRVNLLGKVGAARSNQQGGGLLAAPKETNFDLTFGLGLQFDASKNVGLRLEAQDYPRLGGGPVLPRNNLWLTTVGILWRFR
jgi:OOP family OmpA-OmpF porin